MWDKGIDKKPGKGEFNACGMFVLLPIVENLESSEMFEEAAKSPPLGFRYFTRPIYLFASASSFRNIQWTVHLLNSFFGPGAVLGTEGSTPILRQCPALWDRDRARGSETPKNVLLP